MNIQIHSTMPDKHWVLLDIKPIAKWTTKEAAQDTVMYLEEAFKEQENKIVARERPPFQADVLYQQVLAALDEAYERGCNEEKY